MFDEDDDAEESDGSQKSMLDRILDAVVSGVPDELSTLARELGLSEDRLAQLRERYIKAEEKKIARPVTEVYAEYRLGMNTVVRDLDRITHMAMYPAQGNKQQLRTATDAARARAATLDKMMFRGQELGIFPIASKQTKVQHTGGVLFGMMGTEELVDRMKNLTEDGKRLNKQYEMSSLAALPEPDIYGDGNVIDAEPIKVPVSAPSTPAPKSGRRKA